MTVTRLQQAFRIKGLVCTSESQGAVCRSKGRNKSTEESTRLDYGEEVNYFFILIKASLA